MKALIDADILSYEISSCGQFFEPEDLLREHLVIREFDYVAGLLDQKIREIVAEAGADGFTLYLTGDEHLLKHVNREAKWLGNEPRIFKPNFRHATAKAKPYKGTRKQEKPYHFHNLRAYMYGTYECIVTDGIEADDLICIHLTDAKEELICCTRDKDLRMCEGWHFGWACGKQPAFGPTYVDRMGVLELSTSTPKKIRGTGLRFFFSQLITGDPVDNIPGLPKAGPVFAYRLLADARTEVDMFNLVRDAYEKHFGDTWPENLLEQIDLLWMIRELNEDGSIKFYKWPTGGVVSADPVGNLPDVVDSGQKQSSEVL